ncbi:MAG: autotransporter outer membrane beta-barrel domain-containing protein [Chlamydiales bacterium]|nr:autotransporter outer membrane beta-barrel domain-containing protein [Chlamydiales bacterium]
MPIHRKNWVLYSCVALLVPILMHSQQNIGIIGGYSGDTSVGPSTAYAGLINIKTEVTQLPNLPTGSIAFISSVSMNGSAQSIIVGHQGDSSGSGGTYTALIDPLGNVQVLQSFSSGGNFNLFSAAMNSSNHSIVGGGDGDYFQARVDPSGNFTSLPLSGNGTTTTVAMNDSNLAILGGGSNGLAALIFPNNASITLLTGKNIGSVAINAQGNSLAAGTDQFDSTPYLYTYDASGNPLFGTVTPFTTLSAAINDNNLAIVGGTINTSQPYASFLDVSGNLSPLSGDPLPSLGSILSVDMNDAGYAVIGGNATGSGAYAAFVYPDGTVQTINGLPADFHASINSVSINDFGIALLGGTSDGVNAYAALAAPWTNYIVPLAVNAPQVIYSVSLRTFVPKNILGLYLTGNNLAFAEYIAEYARKKSLFFIPSIFQGTLNEALQSAAPTRNALSVFSAANNYFLLNQALASHLHNYRHSYNKAKDERFAESSEYALLAAGERVRLGDLLEPELEQIECLPESGKRSPYYMWVQPIGAYISQKAQHQTVGFDPAVGGAIVAFEPVTTLHGQFGMGAAYTFTHVHEHGGAGSSNINQEYLFFYGTWSNRRWHVDAACWGSLFQTRQTRYIQMADDHFHASSRPTGTQLSPHLEFGYDRSFCFGKEKQHQWTIDPFIMADWPHTWQKRYQEKGNSPFNATQTAQHSSFLRTEAGIRFYETFLCDSWMFTIEEKGSYVYRHPYQLGTVNAFLVGSPGSFTVETLTSADNLGAVSLSFIFEPLKTSLPSGSLSYHGEFGSGYQSHQINGDITWSF